jgi:NADPH:quinone reductase-like Zn-dependent oxidoreductase
MTSALRITSRLPRQASRFCAVPISISIPRTSNIFNHLPKAMASTNAGRGQTTSHFSNADLKASKLFDVSGLTAVVTGGGTGIGLMITQALVSNGATVYITGRRKEALDKVVEEYSDGPGKIVALPGDITKKDECIRLAKEVGQAESNGVHALINNAGMLVLTLENEIDMLTQSRYRQG